MRASPAVLLLGALAAIVGCGSPCQDLADRICDCQPAGTLRDSCKSSVKNQIGSGAQRPTDADQVFCQQKLQTCKDPLEDGAACTRLQSPQGKVDCGLAYGSAAATLER